MKPAKDFPNIYVQAYGPPRAGKSTLINRLHPAFSPSQVTSARITTPADRGTIIPIKTEHRNFLISEFNSADDLPSLLTDTSWSCSTALIVLDAATGLTHESLFHLFAFALVGAHHIGFVVNKMDTVGWSIEQFQVIEQACKSVIEDMGKRGFYPFEYDVIPVSAGYDDNLRAASPQMPWYAGDCLLDWLEALPSSDFSEQGFSDFAELSDTFKANVLWMTEAPLNSYTIYDFKSNLGNLSAHITHIESRLDSEKYRPVSHHQLKKINLGEVHFRLSRRIIFDPYTINGANGSFCLLDPKTKTVLAIGRITKDLQRSENVKWQQSVIDPGARSRLLRQRPAVLWLTGLSGAGKSTIANALEQFLHARGQATMLLDGDNLRHGLNKDLDFSPTDRTENIRRTSEAAKLLYNAGLIVLVSIISPYAADREMARSIFEPGDFIEIFVDTPLEICEKRDPKGLYKKARAGLIANFTGISSAYEVPQNPEIHLETAKLSVEGCMALIQAHLDKYHIIY